MSDLPPNASATPPEVLLRTFVKEPADEATFTRLVVHFEKLIFSSAFRRSGNTALAEDVTQVVLTILARKAPGLIRHPSLTAWVFQTTKLETMKAIRTETRRQRKHDSLREASLENTFDGEATAWQESVPYLDAALDRLPSRDRELILKRFFENQKFKDIAASQNMTVGACKMQLKRALERLSGHLPTGSSLSVTALGAGLFATLASAPPAKASGLLAKGALGQASSVKATSLLSNTLLTMNNTQKALTTCAVLLTMTAVPAFHMATERSRLNAELRSLESGTELVGQRALVLESGPRSGGERGRSNGRLSADELLSKLSQAMTTKNGVGLLTPFLRVDDLSDEELAQLILDVQHAKKESDVKMKALEVLLELSWSRGNLGHGEKIEQLFTLSENRKAIERQLEAWGKENPTEALAWLKEHSFSGELEGAGARDLYTEYSAGLIRGVLESDPSLGKELYSAADQKIRTRVARSFIKLISEEIHETKTLSLLQDFLTFESNKAIRNDAILSAAMEMSRATGDLDAAADTLNLMGRSASFGMRLTIIASGQQEIPLSQRGTWLEGELGAQLYRYNVSRFIRTSGSEPAEVVEWIESQSDDRIADQGRNGLISNLIHGEYFDLAYRQAAQITDEALRVKAIENTARSWMEHDSEAASGVLPESVLRGLGNE